MSVVHSLMKSRNDKYDLSFRDLTNYVTKNHTAILVVMLMNNHFGEAQWIHLGFHKDVVKLM